VKIFETSIVSIIHCTAVLSTIWFSYPGLINCTFDLLKNKLNIHRQTLVGLPFCFHQISNRFARSSKLCCRICRLSCSDCVCREPSTLTIYVMLSGRKVLRPAKLILSNRPHLLKQLSIIQFSLVKLRQCNNKKDTSARQLEYYMASASALLIHITRSAGLQRMVLNCNSLLLNDIYTTFQLWSSRKSLARAKR
jgi:hypothetical protein